MTTVDARGLACPLPLTMARRRMPDVDRGATLIVLATDPEAAVDLAAFAADAGHGFEQRRGQAWTEFLLTRDGAPKN